MNLSGPPDGSTPLTRYLCRHGHLIGRVWRDPGDDYWIEAGPIKYAAAREAAIRVKNRSVPLQFFRFGPDVAAMFTGLTIMPDGSEVHVDETRELAGCRDVQLVVSLAAMRDDALDGVLKVVLPDDAQRVLLSDGSSVALYSMSTTQSPFGVIA